MPTAATQNRTTRQAPKTKSAKKVPSRIITPQDRPPARSAELAVIYGQLFGNPKDTSDFETLHSFVNSYVGATGPARQQSAKRRVDDLFSQLYRRGGGDHDLSLSQIQMTALADSFHYHKGFASLSPSDRLPTADVW